MLKPKTRQELVDFFQHYKTQYSSANEQGKIVLCYFLFSLEKRIKNLERVSKT